MSPVAEKVCIGCGAELQIPYEEAAPSAACRHQILGSEEESCSRCEASDARLREKWLAGGVVCTECAAKDERVANERALRDQESRWLAKAGLPEPLRGLQWTDLIKTGKRKVAISAALRWAKAPQGDARGLYLWGPAGTGKTHLAATAAWHRLHEERYPLRWVSVAVMLTNMEASFSDKERQAALEVLTGDTPLVMDDIDKVNPSESKRAHLFAAIDRRVTAGVPLLVTGNLSPSELETKLGGPIASRLLGYALGRTFETDGPDRRMTLDV